MSDNEGDSRSTRGDNLTPEQRAKIEAIRQKNRTPEARAREAAIREQYKDKPSIKQLIERGEIDPDTIKKGPVDPE